MGMNNAIIILQQGLRIKELEAEVSKQRVYSRGHLFSLHRTLKTPVEA